MKSKDEFYIGWESSAPDSMAAFTKKIVVAIGFGGVFLAIALSFAQTTISNGVYEWGRTKQFTGTFVAQPYPHLVSQTNTYYLVAPFKHGIDPEIAARLDHQNVVLQGTLIYRDNERMIEVIQDSIQSMLGSTNRTGKSIPLGPQTLVGEIVDSKCYFGVMNPGQFIPHRACAIRCISGGIPPVLVVRHPNGETSCLLLTSKDGLPLNKQILRMIAEPVQVTGDVLQDGHLRTIRAEQIKRFRS